MYAALKPQNPGQQVNYTNINFADHGKNHWAMNGKNNILLIIVIVISGTCAGRFIACRVFCQGVTIASITCSYTREAIDSDNLSKFKVVCFNLA